MKIRRLAPTLIAMAAAGMGAGCALRPSASPAPAMVEASEADGGAVPMDQARLEMLFAEHVEAITGPPGAIETVIDGIQLYCISDAANDRMRFVAPIARASTLDPRVLPVLLQANFHSTLDARYSISEDVVFATFLHPISSLTPELVQSGMAQVLSLVQTFGTSFSAGGVIFAPNRPEEP